MADATLAQGNRLLELILREANPGGFVQALFEKWGEVQQIGRRQADQADISAIAQRSVNPYASWKVRPILSYPKGYKPNKVEDQVKVLLSRLDWLDTSYVARIAASWGEHDQADGLYTVPKPTVLAGRLGLAEHWQNFGLLTEQGPLAALVGQRTFKNWKTGQMGPDEYHLRDSATLALQALEAEQPGDVLVFPAQTGRLFGGFSVLNARWEIEHADSPAQWPLPAYCIGWIVFANQHRLTKYEDLAIDCPGDEYRLVFDEPLNSLCFAFYKGSLHCYHRGEFVDSPDDGCGSSSGFGP